MKLKVGWKEINQPQNKDCSKKLRGKRDFNLQILCRVRKSQWREATATRQSTRNIYSWRNKGSYALGTAATAAPVINVLLLGQLAELYNHNSHQAYSWHWGALTHLLPQFLQAGRRYPPGIKTCQAGFCQWSKDAFHPQYPLSWMLPPTVPVPQWS